MFENLKKYDLLIRIIIALIVVGIWIVLYFYMVDYKRTVGDNPLLTGAEKMGIQCTCTDPDIPGALMYVDGINKEIRFKYPNQEQSSIVNQSELEGILSNIKLINTSK